MEIYPELPREREPEPVVEPEQVDPYEELTVLFDLPEIPEGELPPLGDPRRDIAFARHQEDYAQRKLAKVYEDAGKYNVIKIWLFWSTPGLIVVALAALGIIEL
jgi:hypothetical protein